MIEATLAVLAAGAAYVPLDPAWPRERLETLVREVPLRLLLTESRWLAGLPGEDAAGMPPLLCLDRLDRLAQPAAGETWAETAATADPAGLAYAMFTSGSTGTPKAVGVAHRSVVRLVRGGGDLDFGGEP